MKMKEHRQRKNCSNVTTYEYKTQGYIIYN